MNTTPMQPRAATGKSDQSAPAAGAPQLVPTRFYNARQLSEVTGLGYRTLRTALKEIPSTRLPGARRPVWRGKTVEAFLASFEQ